MIQEEDGLLIFDNQHEAQVARNEAWLNGRSLPLSFYTMELLGEVGEAANIIKKLYRAQQNLAGSTSTTEALVDELADCSITLRNFAIQAGLEYGKNYQLPAEVRKLDDLPSYASFLGVGVGVICSVPIGPLPMDESETGRKFIVEIIDSMFLMIAEIVKEVVGAEFDFDQAVANKFNRSSEANGFPHRVKLGLSLEETFR